MGKPSARLPPVTIVAPRSTASATCAIHLRRRRARCSRGPIVVASSSGSPRRTSRSTSPASSATNSSRTRLVDEQPLGRRAALPGAQEGAHAGGLGGGRRGRRRPSPRAGRCRPSRAAAPCRRPGAATVRPVAVEPVNADGTRAGVGGELVAHLGAGAEHEVEDARRQVGLGDALGEQARADRGGGRRRPDDACCRRRARAPAPRRASCRASSRA